MHFITADLRSHQACKNAVDKALQAMGAINILVLSHAFQMMQETIGDISEYVEYPFAVSNPASDRTAMADVPAGNNGSRPLIPMSTLPYMTLRRHHHHLRLCEPRKSAAPTSSDCTSTKGAIVAFTRALSNQQVGNGIRVNAVCPGPGIFRISPP